MLTIATVGKRLHPRDSLWFKRHERGWVLLMTPRSLWGSEGNGGSPVSENPSYRKPSFREGVFSDTIGKDDHRPYYGMESRGVDARLSFYA